jgi:hypothetical protein
MHMHRGLAGVVDRHRLAAGLRVAAGHNYEDEGQHAGGRYGVELLRRVMAQLVYSPGFAEGSLNWLAARRKRLPMPSGELLWITDVSSWAGTELP